MATVTKKGRRKVQSVKQHVVLAFDKDLIDDGKIPNGGLFSGVFLKDFGSLGEAELFRDGYNSAAKYEMTGKRATIIQVRLCEGVAKPAK